MSDPGKQERIEEFLRRSLLGDELVNTQFHLFSARSLPSGRVVKPRALCANNVLLAKSSKYFLDLLSSDINTSDPSLSDLTSDNDVPNNAQFDDYGYGSDSDLDDCNDPVPVADTKKPKNRTSGLSTSSSKIGATKSKKDDDGLFGDGSESDGSDMFVMSPEHPSTDIPVTLGKGDVGSVASSETAVHGAQGEKILASQTAIRLRSLGSRHILVKDTAFQTWYTLLNYLYTDKFNFLPLGSATPGGQSHESSTNSLDEPKCSAKSMYRLACKVGLDHLRDEAFAYIRSNLTEHNILKELSCSLLSKHPQLLEMELDVLYSHIGSAPVVADFSALAKRIANKELSHGADIIIGIHTRLLKEPRPLPLQPASQSLLTSVWGQVQPASAKVDERDYALPKKEVESKTRSSPPAEQMNTMFTSLPNHKGSSKSACGVQPETWAVPAAILANQRKTAPATEKAPAPATPSALLLNLPKVARPSPPPSLPTGSDPRQAVLGYRY